MNDTKRKIFMIIVLLLVILFGVGQFFAFGNVNNPTNQSGNTGQNPSQPATQVIAYAPNAPASTMPVKKGSCFASSVAAPYRPDAWRCSVGNAISDPCFEIPDASGTLACGENPASTDNATAFVLQLTKPLPKSELASGTSTNWAWLVELADGTICRPFTGTRPFAATGEVATYSCAAPAGSTQPIPGDMIFGDLHNASATWTAEIGSLSTATSTFPPVITASTTMPVFAVWQ